MIYDRPLHPPRAFSAGEFAWIVNNIAMPLPQTVANYIPDVAARLASAVADKVLRSNAVHYFLLWNTITENNFQNRYFFDTVRNTSLFIAMEVAKNAPDAWEMGVNKSVTVAVSGLCAGSVDPNFRSLVVAQTNDPNIFVKAENNQRAVFNELQAVEQQLAGGRPTQGVPPNYPNQPMYPRSAPSMFNVVQPQGPTGLTGTYPAATAPQPAPATPPPPPLAQTKPLEWAPSFEQPFKELVLHATCQTKLTIRNGKPYEEVEVVDREKHRLYQESSAVAPFIKAVENAELISGILALGETDGSKSAIKINEVIGDTSLESSIRLLRLSSLDDTSVGIFIAPILLHTPIFVKKQDDPSKILKALAKQSTFSDIARRMSALYNLAETEIPQSGFSSRDNLRKFIEELDRKLTDFVNQVLMEIHLSTLPDLFIDSFMSDMVGEGSLYEVLSSYERSEGHSRYTLAYNDLEKKASKLLIDGCWPGQEGSFNLDPVAHMEGEGVDNAGVAFLRSPTIVAMTSVTSHELMLQGVRNTPLNINKEGVPPLYATASAIYREDVVKEALSVYLLTRDGGLYRLHQLNQNFVIQRT